MAVRVVRMATTTPSRTARWPARHAVPVLAAIAGAVIVGAAVAADLSIGLGLVAAACYAPLVVVNLRLGIALMVPLLFVDDIYAFNQGAKAAVALTILAWVVGSPGGAARLARRHSWLLASLVLLVLWLTVSLTWAVDLGEAAGGLWQWYVVGALFLVVATTMADIATVRLAAGMFAIGALISVAIGLVQGDLRSTGFGAGRLEGAAGDPNLLAAGLVPALVLALGLVPLRRDPIWRWSAAVGVGVLALGIAASGSRGALVAALGTVVLAMVALPRRRVQVVILSAVVVSVAAVWFSMSPGLWQRVTRVDDRGAGREDLWKVAWAVAGDHPVAGVGLENFTVVSGDYTLRVGSLQNVDLITVRPHEVHNVYLQMLAETGVIGLALFSAFVFGSIAAALTAARRFAARGDEANAALASAVGLAGFAMAAASFFVSNAVDRRLWVLLALGPALLTAASAAQHRPVAGRRATRRR